LSAAVARRPDGSSRQRARGRGFTLAELLIVVAMIGVMAALATVGYRRYLHSAQASEAKAMIQGIRGAEETYKAEMLTYLSCSSSLTNYYPNLAPNDSKWNWVNPNHGDYANWQRLNVSSDGPVRFGYIVVAGIGGAVPTPPQMTNLPTGWPPVPNPGQPWYVVLAAGDRDNNKIFAYFLSSSFSSEIGTENETE
jgi:type IV pilus assembly protein PilA